MLQITDAGIRLLSVAVVAGSLRDLRNPNATDKRRVSAEQFFEGKMYHLMAAVLGLPDDVNPEELRRRGGVYLKKGTVIGRVSHGICGGRAAVFLQAVVRDVDHDQTQGILSLEAKHYKTGSEGFYGQGKLTISGKRYQVQCQLVEIGSKETANGAGEQAATT